MFTRDPGAVRSVNSELLPPKAVRLIATASHFLPRLLLHARRPKQRALMRQQHDHLQAVMSDTAALATLPATASRRLLGQSVQATLWGNANTANGVAKPIGRSNGAATMAADTASHEGAVSI